MRLSDKMLETALTNVHEPSTLSDALLDLKDARVMLRYGSELVRKAVRHWNEGSVYISGEMGNIEAWAKDVDGFISGTKGWGE